MTNDLWSEMLKLGAATPTTRQRRQYGSGYGGYGAPKNPSQNFDKISSTGNKNVEEISGIVGGPANNKQQTNFQSSPPFARKGNPICSSLLFPNAFYLITYFNLIKKMIQ